MQVLVGYASAHGSTLGVAQAIASRLARAGHGVDVRPVEDVSTIDTYDAFVLGSAIHDMAWLPAATSFAERHGAELRSRPLWLFSVGSVGDSSSFFGPRVARVMRRMRSEPKTVTALRPRLDPSGHRAFAGAVERAHWNRLGHLFLVTFGGHYGDHRDWADIARWSDGIAAELSALAPAGTPAP